MSQGNNAKPVSGGSHRAPPERTFGAQIGLTVLGAVFPGSGFWFAGKRVLGGVVFGVFVALVATGTALGMADPRAYLHAAVRTDTLLQIAIGCIVVAVAWVIVVVASHLLLSRGADNPSHRIIGLGVVVVLCAAVALPLAVGARYAYAQRDAINHVFSPHVKSATAPEEATADDPWAGADRVNVLLLGGDGGVDRTGIRTDSMILASIDTHSGDTVLFSLPRNLQHAPFPEGSPLHKYYPNGFSGPGDLGNWLLNAIYRMVPMHHPGVLGATDNEGADALKQSIGEIVGLHVDYYVLINLAGFQELIDALGGITVNVNNVVSIGGNHDTGQPPTGWIQPGPDKHLDGFDALWFARGRWNTSDYDRMQRQRCVIDAIIEQANPSNLLLRYEEILKAGKKIVRTDIPQKLLPALVDLALKVKDADLKSVVFTPNDHFQPASPDFDYMRSVVGKALTRAAAPERSQRPDRTTPRSSSTTDSTGTPTTPTGPGGTDDVGGGTDIAQEPTDVCAYHPTG